MEDGERLGQLWLGMGINMNAGQEFNAFNAKGGGELNLKLTSAEKYDICHERSTSSSLIDHLLLKPGMINAIKRSM